jgi:hypothetical protein
MSTVYRACPVKRYRRTNAELEAIDEAIVYAVRDEHPVSLRGVYYRVVSAGAIGKTEKAYNLIGRELLKLRRSGAVPYSWITDGTRLIQRPDSWNDLDDMLEDAAASYRRTLWHKSNVEIMMFTEKDAISGVLCPITSKWDVELGVIRGYASETFAYTVAEEIMSTDKFVVAYQFGDHDPSGVDAWRDFQAKVSAFVAAKHCIPNMLFERLAVTPEQIADFHLLTRPTKKSDTRARGFIGESVEVDAIPASILRQIAEDAITQHIDEEALRLTQVAEDSERKILTRLAGGFRFVDDDQQDAP